MSVGQLRERVTFQTETKTADGYGGFDVSWVDAATVWASIIPVSASQKWKAQQLDHEISHKITIRSGSNIAVDPSQRIAHRGRVFHIQSHREIEERGRWVEIMANEGAPA